MQDGLVVGDVGHPAILLSIDRALLAGRLVQHRTVAASPCKHGREPMLEVSVRGTFVPRNLTQVGARSRAGTWVAPESDETGLPIRLG
jgi:hypothetical protein